MNDELLGMTDNEMIAKIHGAIDESMTAQVGERLRLILRKAERDGKRVDTLEDLVKVREGTIAERDSQIESLETSLAQHVKLDRRELDLAERERGLHNTLQAYEIEYQKSVINHLMKIQVTLTSNPVLKRNIVNTSMPCVDAQGGMTYHDTQQNITETTE